MTQGLHLDNTGLAFEPSRLAFGPNRRAFGKHTRVFGLRRRVFGMHGLVLGPKHNMDARRQHHTTESLTLSAPPSETSSTESAATEQTT